MTALRETPGTVPEKNRHRRPWKDSDRRMYVPLVEPHEEGQWFMGRFAVPARLTHKGVRHTNDELEFQRICEKQIERWRLMRQMKGWVLSSRPIVTGPVAMPTATANTEGEEDRKVYFVRARFRRMYTDYLLMEDLLHLETLGKRYGVDIEADRLPWNPDTKRDSGWVNPEQYAEERRKRLGIHRKDYLFDSDITKPLGMVDVPGTKEVLKKKKGRG